MAADLLASLRPWAIHDIQLGERIYHIPAHTADVWLEILLPEQVSLHAIIPGLLQPDAHDHLTDLVIDGRISRQEWENLVWEVVGIAAGRDWWTALYLLGNAKHPQHIDAVRAQLAFHHIDATRISLAQWLDAIYGIFTQNMEPEGRRKFDMQLAKPPASAVKKIDRARQRAAFMELQASSQ